MAAGRGKERGSHVAINQLICMGLIFGWWGCLSSTATKYKLLPPPTVPIFLNFIPEANLRLVFLIEY